MKTYPSILEGFFIFTSLTAITKNSSKSLFQLIFNPNLKIQSHFGTSLAYIIIK